MFFAVFHTMQSKYSCQKLNKLKLRESTFKEWFDKLWTQREYYMAIRRIILKIRKTHGEIL